MAHGAWRMAHGAWRMAHGAWRMAHGAWRMAHGAWRMAHGAWRMARAWRMAHGAWRMAHGAWRMAHVACTYIHTYIHTYTHTYTHTYIALKLAKIPDDIITNIRSLAEKWATEIHLQTQKSATVTDFIKYLTGVLQGDCLNPLSYFLNLYCRGYSPGPTGNRASKLTHLFFVDDLKTYAKNRTDAEKQLEVITEFSNDNMMKFVGDKCAFLAIERGERKIYGKNICLNVLVISELEVEDSYKYLGLDEDLSYKGELNKERVITEFYNRVRKIWRSELSAKNKVHAHNVFAVPVLTGTIGVLDWTKEELSKIDVKTRKLLTCTGNFHRNSNVHRLYTPREDGGRGLNSIFDVFIVRILALVQHLQTVAPTHKYLMTITSHPKREKSLRRTTGRRGMTRSNMDSS